MHEITVWRQAPILLAVLPQIAFVLIVSLPALGAGQWWRPFATRALVFKSGTLLLLILAATIANVSADVTGPQVWVWSWPSGSDAYVVAGYWAVCWAIWYQLFALLHERRAAHRARHATPS